MASLTPNTPQAAEPPQLAFTMNVLLVDDDPICRKILMRLLPKVLPGASLMVDSAENGLEALDAISKKRYDLLLTDCDMPVLGGIEACWFIRNGTDFTQSRQFQRNSPTPNCAPGVLTPCSSPPQISSRNLPSLHMAASTIPAQVGGSFEAPSNTQLSAYRWSLPLSPPPSPLPPLASSPLLTNVARALAAIHHKLPAIPQSHTRLPIVVVSSRANDDNVVKFLAGRVGVNGVVGKPAHVEKLRKVVAAAIEGYRVASRETCY
ncbi:hypothetical protein BJ742DRAFT_780198 [Cladochytrium replicatum]|nr:hypothetical protein BJ742DRAFT_780198 [Cladochytrium replicatum]